MEIINDRLDLCRVLTKEARAIQEKQLSYVRPAVLTGHGWACVVGRQAIKQSPKGCAKEGSRFVL